MGTDTAALAAYERVAKRIRSGIRSGLLEPGARLPSHRRLAEQYDVALGTAQKAVQLLTEEGWLTVAPSVGVFVAEQPPTDEPTPDVREIVRAVATLQTAVAELRERVAKLEAGS